MSEQDWGARLDAVRDDLGTLAAEVRRLIAATVSADAPREVLARAAQEVARIAQALEAHVPTPHPPRYPGSLSADAAADFFPFDPIVGRLSPLAPPLRMSWQDPVAVGEVRFDVPYEGPPGCVHGGVIAATFDQVFNVANLMRGVAGPTRRLEVRYLKPTPLLTPLRFEGWVERVEGREVHSKGRILHGDLVTVEASGVFVQLSHERVMQLLGTAKQEPPEKAAVREQAPAKESAAARRRRFREGGDGT
jgi:acyl-coenzyme A thioesterase PaaI-like protein